MMQSETSVDGSYWGSNRATDEDGNEEDVITIRALGEGEPPLHQIRVSCPDATGLGCDITRMLLDFGCRILDGDISTDGRWCFMMYKVVLGHGMRVSATHWALLKERLYSICPGAGGPKFGRDFDARARPPQPHLLEVSCYDRRGCLHDLMNTLWEADVAVYKAHVTTGPGGDVLDLFWIFDNRRELPEVHRQLQIQEAVRTCLHQKDAKCTITSAPEEAYQRAGPACPSPARLRACTDATSASPLRQLVMERSHSASDHSALDVKSSLGEDGPPPPDQFGEEEVVSVELDNQTASAYSVINVVCRDRKGLVYDMMRTLKDIQIRVGYAKIKVKGERAEADIFVQEENGKLVGEEHQSELMERVTDSVRLPVRISINDVYDSLCTELCVTANVDSAGRGRPRVTYDVTKALSSLNLCVFTADVYVEMAAKGADKRPLEMHRFLVHTTDGQALKTAAEKRHMYDVVRAQLTGTSPKSTGRQALQFPLPRPAPGAP